MLGFPITGAATAGALMIGYQSMAPTGQWFGKTFFGLSSESQQLALTFDDGPNDPHTMHLLEMLVRHQVQATFFLIGSRVQQRPDIVRKIAAAGHSVGNHTYTHPLLTLQSTGKIRGELADCRSALRDAAGDHSNLFRPPFGGRRPAVLRIANELGLKTIMWNVTGYDWNAPPAAVIEKKVIKQVRGGSVILLHDGGHKQIRVDRSQTVLATDRLITRYKDQGYSFVTIEQMMGSEPTGSNAR